MAPLREPPRVLVADGYADAADSLALLLALWGYDVRVAYSGAEAALMAPRYRPHVAVLELRLDGMDGFRLADQIRAQCGGDIALVALTSLGDAANRRRSRACGFAAHLVKPIEPEQLRRLLAPLAVATTAHTGPVILADPIRADDALVGEWRELF